MMEQQFTLVLESYTSGKRNETIFNIEKAIQNAGAWIISYSNFSETFISFVIESEPSKIKNLFDCLSETKIEFYKYSYEQYLEISERKLKTDILISLNVSFVGGEKGDLGTGIDMNPSV